MERLSREFVASATELDLRRLKTIAMLYLVLDGYCTGIDITNCMYTTSHNIMSLQTFPFHKFVGYVLNGGVWATKKRVYKNSKGAWSSSSQKV